MKNKNYKAFTLVELIVVITILAVLATVAFISFQGYTSSSRDSVRLADLKNIEKQLNIHFTQNNIYPDPSSPVSIPTGGTQGELGKSVTNQIGVSQVRDPLTQNYYFYRISQNKRKYQLMGFLENSDSITFSPLRSTFAENDIPYSKGDKLGIVLNSDGKTLPTTIDLSTGTYNVIFSNKTEENLTNVSGEDNFVELKAADKGVFDESLVGYWDMETMTADGKLADLSGNNNHGTIHDANNSGLTTPVNGAMVFDGVDDYVEVVEDDSFDFGINDDFTISIDLEPQASNTYQQVFAKGLGSTYPYKFEIVPSGNSYFAIYDSIGSINVYLTDEIIINKKTATFVKNGYKLSVYQNGELVDEKNFSDRGYDIQNDVNLFIGSRHAGARPYKGKLDNMMIFNRALSEGEIKNFYQTVQ